MEDAAARWWVIGSAAVVLHGVHTSVADIDLLLDVSDADRIAMRRSLTWVEGQDTDLFRSERYGLLTDTALPIELMAGLRVRGEPLVPATRVSVSIGDATVHVPDKSEMIAIFDRFDRPKDRRRAALLRASAS